MNQEKIGKFIYECRKEKKLSQRELAEKLKVSDRSISNWENGKNKPDLSLFKPLCEILDITVNDLMSGEKVEKEDYQEKFEENMVNVVSKASKKNKGLNIFLWTYLIIISMILIFLLSTICLNFEFTQPYDENNMQIVSDDTNEYLSFYSSFSGTVNFVTRNYIENNQNIGLIFINYQSSILNLLAKDKNSVIDKDNLKCGKTIDLRPANLPLNYKVYYTDIKLSEISNASEKELENIIKKSHLMYENNNELLRN